MECPFYLLSWMFVLSVVIVAVRPVPTGPSRYCTFDIEEKNKDCSGRELENTLLSDNSEVRKKVESINFSNNNIIRLEGLYLYPNLTKLDLSLNLIENISSDAFSGLDKLVSLDLSYNNFEKINPYLFMNHTKLKRLSLQGNLLDVTPDNPIICSTSLHFLNLGTCALTSLTVANLMCLPFLTELDLSSNAFTSLTPSVFSPLSHLQVINLSINRFYCDCKLPVLLKWAKSKKTDLAGPEPLYCVLPQNRGRREYSKIEKDLNCSRDSSTLPPPPLKHQPENSSSEFYDYILISYDTNIQPADGHIPISFMGLISSKLYTIEALLSLVLFLLVLITVMMFCRHYRTVGDVSAILNEYSVHDHYFPSDKMSTHLIEKNPKDHTYAHVK